MDESPSVDSAREMDDGSDFYLTRLLEERKRRTLPREEAEWIESYIIRQHAYKLKHGVSIDTIDQNLCQVIAGRAPTSGMNISQRQQQQKTNVNRITMLSDQPTEYLVSVMAVTAFIGLALGIQALVVFGTNVQL